MRAMPQRLAGSFIQTLTMVDIATGWTECLPLVTRDGSLVVEAMTRAQSLFPWLIHGADFDNDSAFMNDVVVPWCREQKIEVTRSRAYKKNDQAFVEQKNGAVVRRLVGYALTHISGAAARHRRTCAAAGGPTPQRRRADRPPCRKGTPPPRRRANRSPPSADQADARGRDSAPSADGRPSR